MKLINKEAFYVTLIEGDTEKELNPKRIHLDSSGTKLIFQFEFEDSFNEASIKIRTQPGILTVQNKAREDDYFTGFPVSGKKNHFFSF